MQNPPGPPVPPSPQIPSSSQTPAAPQTTTCPYCGFANESGGPVCGNCGRQLQGGYEYSGSLADKGTGWVKLAVIAAILVGIGALLWTQGPKLVDSFNELTGTDAVDEALDELNELDDLDDIGGGGNSAGNNGSGNDVESPYNSVKELVAALNKGGLDCNRVKTDLADDTIATGSCQAPGEVARIHVQINIYFFRPSLESARDIMAQRAFTYVHDANWFVVTQLETAKEVHDILGGKLVRAKN